MADVSPPIVLLPCSSSNIQELGYCPETKRLRIRFKSGGLYTYADVPESEYEALRAAPSLGKYFHTNIRGNFDHTQEP